MKKSDSIDEVQESDVQSEVETGDANFGVFIDGEYIIIDFDNLVKTIGLQPRQALALSDILRQQAMVMMDSNKGVVN